MRKVALVRRPKFQATDVCQKAEIKSSTGEIVGGAKALTENRAKIEDGKFKPAEPILQGVESVPKAFADVFQGNDHVGKVVFKIAEQE